MSSQNIDWHLKAILLNITECEQGEIKVLRFKRHGNKINMNNIFIEKRIQGTSSGSKMLKSLSSNMAHSRNIKKIAKTLHTDAFRPPAFLRVCQDPFLYRCIFEPNQRIIAQILISTMKS